MERLARRIYNIYQQKRRQHRRAVQYKKVLVKYGLFKHGNVNDESKDAQTVQRRKKQIYDFLQHHDDMVNDDYNMKSEFVQYQYHLHPEIFTFLKPRFEKIFVKNQTYLNQMLSQNVDYGCSLVMAGVIHNWSRRRWNDWNKYVCSNID